MEAVPNRCATGAARILPEPCSGGVNPGPPDRDPDWRLPRTTYPGDVDDGAVRDLEHASGVEPLRTNDRTTVLVGCALWAVLLVLSVLNRDALEADGHGWWLWTCVAGLVLGAVGLVGLQVRNRRSVAPGGAQHPS